MSFIVLAAYPNEEGATFDQEYYINTHMPLVESHWKPLGLVKWQLLELGDLPKGGGKSPYLTANVMTFTSKEAFEEILGGSTLEPLLEDAAKLSNVKPVFLNGSIVGSG